MAKSTIKITKTPNLKHTYSKLYANKVGKALNASGSAILLSIKKRIKNEKDHKGGTFKALNKEYEKAKRKQGKNKMFELSGEMLRSFTFKVNKGNKYKYSLLYYFDNKQMKKRAQHNINNGRDFVNISKNELNIIKKQLKK